MSCLVGQGFGVCGRYPVLKAWKQLLAWEPAWRQPGRQDVWGLAPVLSPTCCVSHSSPCFSFPICNLSCPDDFMALPAFLCCDSEPEREQGQQTGMCVCVQRTSCPDAMVFLPRHHSGLLTRPHHSLTCIHSVGLAFLQQGLRHFWVYSLCLANHFGVQAGTWRSEDLVQTLLCHWVAG